MTRFLVGTSGYAYAPWKGRFYPARMAEADMLPFYAEHFPAVEINNTFYRMPSTAVLERWSAATPESFTFVLKAPQRITHRRRIADAAATLSHFLDTSAALGPKRGAVLYQLPPYALADLAGLRAFLDLLPPAPRAAFEFRHASWSDEAVHRALEDRGMAVCVADTDEAPATAVPPGRWAYVRLRRSSYTDEDLRAFADRVVSSGAREAFVFFKHEDEARGPALARRLLAILGEPQGGAVTR